MTSAGTMIVASTIVIVFLVLLFLIALGGSAVKASFDDDKTFRAPYDEYQAKATAELVTPAEDSQYEYVTRVAEEWRNLKMTQRAILVLSHERGAVIHQFKCNGEFSEKGPYFISMKVEKQNWVPFGKFHVVRTIRGKNGHGWKPKHPYQDGVVGEVGLQIVEWESTKRPPISFRDFVRRYHPQH